jgi:hypothetical protein
MNGAKLHHAGKSAPFRFPDYVCPGDSRSVEDGFFTFTIRIEPDLDAKPSDYDCYSKKAIRAWEREDWFFCGLVVSGEYNGVPLPDAYLAALWGIEANFPGSRNRNLARIAEELLPEAKDRAEEVLEEMLERLTA